MIESSTIVTDVRWLSAYMQTVVIVTCGTLQNECSIHCCFSVVTARDSPSHIATVYSAALVVDFLLTRVHWFLLTLYRIMTCWLSETMTLETRTLWTCSPRISFHIGTAGEYIWVSIKSTMTNITTQLTFVWLATYGSLQYVWITYIWSILCVWNSTMYIQRKVNSLCVCI